MWLILGNIALIAAALVTTSVVVAYSFMRFEQTQVGRQFWLTKASLALILDFGAINLFVTGSPRTSQSTPVRAVIYIIVTFVMLRWLIIIIKAQREARQKTNTHS
jgi:ABC-type amino acid transport system permease subunit